jgi:hypothetical protein
MTFPRQGCWIWLHCILRVSVSSRSHVSKHSAPLLDASHLGDCCRDGKHRWSPAAPLTSPIKLKQPGEATSQCAQQRFSKLPADGRDVGRLGTTRYYKNGNLNQWWLRKSMLKLINIFGLGPGWGLQFYPCHLREVEPQWLVVVPPFGQTFVAAHSMQQKICPKKRNSYTAYVEGCDSTLLAAGSWLILWWLQKDRK